MGLNLGQAVPGWTVSTAASVDVVKGCWDDPDNIRTLEIARDDGIAYNGQKQWIPAASCSYESVCLHMFESMLALAYCILQPV